MNVRKLLCSPLLVVAVGVLFACGGGSSKKDEGPGDESSELETITPDIPEEGVTDVPVDDGTVDPDARDVQPTDNPVTDEVAGDNPPVELPGELPGDATGEVPPDADQEVEQPLCPCDETIQDAEVCVQGAGCAKTEYKSDRCAKCALCADGPGCKGCTGTRTDCTDVPKPNYFSWKGTCDICPCDTQDECDAIPYPDCGKVCAEKGGVYTEYTDVCAMKADFCCAVDYADSIYNFGACPKPVCEPCLGQEENPVCGSDGKTYANQCSLVNCGGGATRACFGACAGRDFCPACPTTCAPVCGDDNVTYANECAATTCGTKGKLVAYEGVCCPECDDQPMVEVCATNGNAYPNQCYALCHGATPCPPKTAGSEVCGLDGKTWDNTCWSTCKAGGYLHEGACTRLCEQCPATYTPVCATNPQGAAQTYASECFKLCLEGTGTSTSGVCASCTAQCSNATPETVCGSDGITYPNRCIPEKCLLIPVAHANGC